MRPRRSSLRKISLGTLLPALGMAGPALLTGCGGGGGGGGTPAPLSASAQTPDGLTATLTQQRSAVAQGGTVTYTLTLTNTTSQAISYEQFQGCGYAGRENAHLRITNAAGEVAYPADQSGACGPVTPSPPALAPGASVSDTYTPPASAFTAGHYTVVGSFDTISGDEVLQTNVGPLTVDVT